MLVYIVRRILLGIFTTWMITVLTFIVIQAPPGDSVSRYIDELMAAGDQPAILIADRLRSYVGLDKPMHERYLSWMWNMLHGDFGLSFQKCIQGCGSFAEKSVKEIVKERIWLTIVLTGFTVAVTWTFAVPVGIYSAVRQHSVGDYMFTFLGFSGLAVPDFLLGLVLMYFAFAYFDQSVGGLFSADYVNAPWSIAKARDLVSHLWIPAVVLGTSGTASLIRIMRNNLLDELAKPYVITARAKGVNPIWIIIKYPTRVAVNPLVSTAGYLLPSLFSGSVIVSVVLSLPTIGPVLLAAIRQEDVYLAGFIIFVLGILTVVGTLISDILLVIIDPRIKYT